MTILFPHYLVRQQLGLVSAIWISWIILLLFLLLVVHAASHLVGCLWLDGLTQSHSHF